jgi:FlaA1/EpsC-like NDP-sugar epimerase
MSVPQNHDWNRFLSPASAAVHSRFQACLKESHAGECILVTGAGGSIGSALVLAIAAATPCRIVLLESSEYALFEVLQRLEAAYPRIAREVLLGSCGDATLLDRILDRFRPDIIYHAAAFKHVALLEENPFAAVRNNAIATYTLAKAAVHHRTPKLVLVSTDKAVNPRSVLGVTKRISELVVVSLSSSSTRMNAVRLANVIGSSGSVVPIFLRQIAAGGPVTVTHPDATRRFLTLTETVEAILAAGASHCEGRILLPPMGEPISITDLARFLIDGREIPIQFTGLGPGEKLTEDLVFASEVSEGESNGCLQVITTPALPPEELASIVEQLVECHAARDFRQVAEALHRAVPEYALDTLRD